MIKNETKTVEERSLDRKTETIKPDNKGSNQSNNSKGGSK